MHRNMNSRGKQEFVGCGKINASTYKRGHSAELTRSHTTILTCINITGTIRQILEDIRKQERERKFEVFATSLVPGAAHASQSLRRGGKLRVSMVHGWREAQ